MFSRKHLKNRVILFLELLTKKKSFIKHTAFLPQSFALLQSRKVLIVKLQLILFTI